MATTEYQTWQSALRDFVNRLHWDDGAENILYWDPGLVKGGVHYAQLHGT